MTAADYARAEKFLLWNTAPLVSHATGRATWLSDGRFWYKRTTADGSDFRIVDPRRGSSAPAFDHFRLAAALSTAAGKKYDRSHLPFATFELARNGNVSFDADSQHWICDMQKNACSKVQPISQYAALSPDKRRIVFIRDYNLWVRDLGSGRESQLTADGSKDFGYATDNPSWKHTDRAIVRWSPDSKRIATYQQDDRGVGEMYLVTTKVGHPELDAWKYTLPGDDVVPTIHRVVIDVDKRQVVRFQMPPDPRRASHCYDLECGDGQLTDVQWSADGRQLAFISTSRDHRTTTLRIADAVTGSVRDVLQERTATFYYSATSWAESAVNWRYLWATNEIVWFSQRDNWGHLYLYDATNGKLEHSITTGPWNVMDLLQVDEAHRTLYLLGVGREAGRNPYFAQLYRVGLDGKDLTLLTPEDATHLVSMAPSGDYFVDRYSRPDAPPVAVLRNRKGKLVSVLEKADITDLTNEGWRPPIPITVKARDGTTDLYGLMFKPTNFDESRKYPIIDCIYPGPQVGSVNIYSFAGISPSMSCDAQSLAELGFIVVAIDGMGTPMRSKAFQDTYYGNMGDNTLPDQVTALRQLVQRYSWIDIERAGILGISGGGYATADALFRYPDFFKVGVSESGNHDNRGLEGDWGEEFQGLLERKPDGASNYDNQANQSIAKNLKGHLLLIHGTLDDNTPPYLTLLVVDALIKANKDFDLLMVPNQRHGPSANGTAAPYVKRRRWDYFVRNLMGVEPPRAFELQSPKDDWQESVERAFSRP